MVWATVDVELSGIDDVALIDHLIERGYVVHDKDEVYADSDLMPIFEALHLGKQELAIKLMSSYISYKTGRVL